MPAVALILCHTSEPCVALLKWTGKHLISLLDIKILWVWANPGKANDSMHTYTQVNLQLQITLRVADLENTTTATYGPF